MHKGKVLKHRNAFLPHFFARGLSIYYKQNSTAPFEVFYYEPEQWAKMIIVADDLEYFDPCRKRGYYRTLVWLRLLPEDYEDEQRFPKYSIDFYNGDRNMEIAPELWKNYEKVPCWVYSNIKANVQVVKEDQSPIIWPTS